MIASPLLATLPFTAPDAPVLVAYSGGLDSTVLLHRLSADPVVRARGLRALHVDHGLQAASAGWAQACVVACAALGIECIVRRVDVVDTGHGPEAAARAARRSAFAAELHDGEWLALAHHRDDQAETVLLRLLRGSGVDGLGAMRATTAFAGGTLWRPLLPFVRAQLHAAALDAGLAWHEDASNADARFDRNFVRAHVLPVLAARWPHASDALANSAALLAADAALLAQETARHLAAVQGIDPATLRRDGLRALPAAWRARVLRAWLAALDLPPAPARTLAAIDAQLLPARDDAQARVAWAGAEVRAWGECLHAAQGRPGLASDWSHAWDGRAALALPTGDALDCIATSGEPGIPAPALALGPFRLAARQGGERIRLAGRSHTHAVKKCLQDLGVPPWERARLPLVHAADGELLAVGDVLVSARLAATGARFRMALVGGASAPTLFEYS